MKLQAKEGHLMQQKKTKQNNTEKNLYFAGTGTALSDS